MGMTECCTCIFSIIIGKVMSGIRSCACKRIFSTGRAGVSTSYVFADEYICWSFGTDRADGVTAYVFAHKHVCWAFLTRSILKQDVYVEEKSSHKRLDLK